MAKGVDIVVIADDGSVVPEGRETRYRLRNSAGRYRLLSDTPGLLVMRRALGHEIGASDDADDIDFAALLEEDTTPIEAGGRVVLAGEILTPMTLFQTIEIVAERGFVGELQVFSSGGRHFELLLDRGALIHARSNDPADRLGELLVKQGVVTREALGELLACVSEKNRLGQLCLERGLVDGERLFALLGAQVTGILLRCLTVADGAFVFTTPDPTRPPAEHTVHLSVRALLMDGIRRLDEIEVYRRVVPGGDVCLRALASPRTANLEPDALLVLERCDGETTLTEIGAACELDEFAVTRAAYFLVKARCVEMVSRDRLDEADLRRVVATFSDVLREVFAAMDGASGSETARQMLGAWIDGSGYSSYFGTDVVATGELDAAAVLATARASRDEDPLATLMHVAHELVSFALFCAGSVLPREREMALSKAVNARLGALRRA